MITYNTIIPPTNKIGISTERMLPNHQIRCWSDALAPAQGKLEVICLIL